MKPKIEHPLYQSSQYPMAQALADQVGEFIEYWGFKAVQGRLWLYLFVSKVPLSSIDLGNLLEISPALVTQSVQILLEYKVILRASKGPNGVLRYQANPNVAEAIRGVLLHREKYMMEKMGKTAEAAYREAQEGRPGALQIDPERLAQIRRWTALFQLLLLYGTQLLKSDRNPFAEPDAFLSQVKKFS
jgi:DNA-binding transcriptional regulator GbsR (MarR family)